MPRRRPSWSTHSRDRLPAKSSPLMRAYGIATVSRLQYSGGAISASGLGSNTPGTADEKSILEGKTAWVDGKLIKGSIKTYSATTQLQGGERESIPFDGAAQRLAGWVRDQLAAVR